MESADPGSVASRVASDSSVGRRASCGSANGPLGLVGREWTVEWPQLAADGVRRPVARLMIGQAESSVGSSVSRPGCQVGPSDSRSVGLPDGRALRQTVGRSVGIPQHDVTNQN